MLFYTAVAVAATIASVEAIRIDPCDYFSQIDAYQEVQVSHVSALAEPVKPNPEDVKNGKVDPTKEDPVSADIKMSTYNVRVPPDANDQKMDEIVGKLQ